jgi:RNA polymerase sigma-70 factor (sigma-E family)
VAVMWEAPKDFDDFVRSRHVALLRFAHLICGDPHQAEDLVQEALEKAGLRWRSILRPGNPEAYVRRSIVNAHLNLVRRRSRERLVAQAPEPTGYLVPAERDEQLWRVLADLPPRQRAVLVLRFYEDLTEAEAARVLGCSVGTVKSNGFRALAKLRALLPAQETTQTGGEPR